MMKLKSDQTIVFIGDSITDCDRRTMHPPIGRGYVKMFATMLAQNEPDINLNIINRGISGDVITGVRSRWDQDVTQYDPEWIAIKIGINDIHSTLSNDWGINVYPELYREAYEDIMGYIKDKLPKANVLLIDPFYISTETDPDNQEAKVLELIKQYLTIVHDMSQKNETLLIKTHDIFQELLKTHDREEYCPEPVHPNDTGHMVIAEAVYETLS